MNQIEIFIFLGGGLTQKIGGQFKNLIRYATMCYELEALLLNLNYKFDKVSWDIHV